VVALQHNLPVFGCSAASAKTLQFMSNVLQVAVFVFDAVDYGAWSAEFSGFEAYANPLLLFFYFATNA
jgi:hypothetical protein